MVAAAGDPCDATAELCHVLEVGGGAGAGSEAVDAGEDPAGGVSHVEWRDAGSSLAGSPETAVPGDDPDAPGVGGPAFAGGSSGGGFVPESAAAPHAAAAANIADEAAESATASFFDLGRSAGTSPAPSPSGPGTARPARSSLRRCGCRYSTPSAMS